MVFRLAEVLGAEQLLETDHRGAARSGTTHAGDCLGKILFRVGGAAHLYQADGEFLGHVGIITKAGARASSPTATTSMQRRKERKGAQRTASMILIHPICAPKALQNLIGILPFRVALRSFAFFVPLREAVYGGEAVAERGQSGDLDRRL